MSKNIRYDALLVRGLAAELGRRLDGARVHGARFDTGALTVRVATGRGTLVWALPPAPGGLRLLPRAREPGNLPVRAGSRLAGFGARPDERILEIAIGAPPGDNGALYRIVLELFGTHANAFALDATDSILMALRGTAAGRALERGLPWKPPAPRIRAGLDGPLDAAAFHALLDGIPPAFRAAALLEGLAWISPINAAPILGSAAAEPGPAAVQQAYERFLEICHGPARPVLLRLNGGQPYPCALPGLPSEPVPDLLSAFQLAGSAAAGTPRESALEAVAARRRAAARRCARLRAEMEGAAAHAARTRRAADLLLTHARAVERGATEVLLDDFEGGTVRVELDPAVDATTNADRLYDRARKRDRAARRIPGLLERAALDGARLDALEAAIRAGGETVNEALWRELDQPPPRRRPGREAVRLPYRRYRSRSGLEIRVGRGSRDNDDLTLRHARPEDIWLHARDTAGAHVVLVWGRRDQNPPEADLVDAAVLAALHSRARTSATVPVDWTRRKYVRKPRRTPPGTVLLERSRTLFVQPDPEAETRLRPPGFQG